MRYLIVTSAGLYGPADLAQLAQWAGEGRVAPSTILEEEGTGNRLSASSLAGLSFTTFQQTPVATNVVAATPTQQPMANTPIAPMKPIPPQVVSNYRRPDYQAPLFLAKELDGRRELLYSFILAFAAPVVALIHIYGIGMAFGGIYCGVIALKRGKRLGALSLALSILAVPAALFLHFGLHWLL
ncbi:MAG: hypothetical protein ACHQ50_05715 [Fimbriimonadales bacterium]